MNIERFLLHDIKTKKLQWYGHVQRMEEGRFPKEVMKWSPPGRRKLGRPKLNWTEGIRGLMGKKGLMEEDWNDRGNWRKKIIVKWTQEDVETLYKLLNNINNNNNNNNNISNDIRMQAEALVFQPDTTPPQPNHNVTPTYTVPEKYNP